MSEMTVRSHLETIRDKLYFALLLTTSHETSLEATRIARESAVAALELLDAAEREFLSVDYGRRLLDDPDIETLRVQYCPRADAHCGHSWPHPDPVSWCDGVNQDGTRPYTGVSS